MHYSVVIVALVVLCASASAQEDRRMVVLDHPAEWVEGPVLASEQVKLHLALYSKHGERVMEMLEEHLKRSADPRSTFYGRHLSREQARRIVGASDYMISSLKLWVEANGMTVDSVSFLQNFMYISGPVEQVEQAFKAPMKAYFNADRNVRVIRFSQDYHLSGVAASVVQFITGANYFPQRPGQVETYPVARSPRVGGQTPTSLGRLYNVTFTTKEANRRSSQAPVEFDDSFYSPSDLQTFFKDYDEPLVGQKINKVYGNSGSAPISIEANLDTQWIMAMGTFVNTTLYSYGLGANIIDQFLQWADEVGGQVQPPLVQSISFGQYGGGYDNSTVQRVNQELATIGALGVTVLVASGDIGVGCNAGGTKLVPPFPTAPYCTMVGATEVVQDGTSEDGATLSSGGFSNDYWAPDWQAAAISTYFNTVPRSSLPSQEYNKNGRGFPDLSSCGVDMSIVARGEKTTVGGTSCSAPTVGGLVSLLNNYRLNAGKTALGWINPLIYQNPQAFNDITRGRNGYRRCTGFPCAAGWDPVTGVGSPNFGLLLDVVMNLP